jgi:hypothetical protein
MRVCCLVWLSLAGNIFAPSYFAKSLQVCWGLFGANFIGNNWSIVGDGFSEVLR